MNTKERPKDLATVVGYTSLWHIERNTVSIELAIVGGGRELLEEMDCAQAHTLIAMLTKNGKKSVSYKKGDYLQSSEFYPFK